jgi:hypothetical protein
VIRSGGSQFNSLSSSEGLTFLPTDGESKIVQGWPQSPRIGLEVLNKMSAVGT